MAIFGASILPQAAIQAALAGQGGAKDSQGPMNGDYPYAVPQMPAYKQPSTGRMVLGGIGDALQEWSGGHATFGPEMERQRQYAMQLQAAQMQRAQQFADQKALYAWKQANPAPTQFEQDLRAAGIDPASPQGRALYQQRVKNLADPIQAIQSKDPNTGQPGLLFVRPSQMGGQSGPPQEAVSALLRGEGTDAQFDQIFGAGAAARARGSAGISDQQGGSILSGGAQTGVISPAQAAQIRASLGPNGQAAFQQWMVQNHITIGGN